MSLPTDENELFLSYSLDATYHIGFDPDTLSSQQYDSAVLMQEQSNASDMYRSTSMQDIPASDAIAIPNEMNQFIDLDGFIKPADDPIWSIAGTQEAGAVHTRPRSFGSANERHLMVPPTSRHSRTLSDLGSHYENSQDSGYQTRNTKAGWQASSPTYSVTESHAWSAPRQLCPSENLYTTNSQSFMTLRAPSTTSEEAASICQGSYKGGSRKRHAPFACESCGKKSKTQSEANKHGNTHEKRYKCDIPDCPRTEGFSTPNDLDRHRTSVHQLRSTIRQKRGHICVLCMKQGDKRKGKFWPRKDNFKAHIMRKHKIVTDDQTQINNYLDRIYRDSEADRPDDAMTANLTECHETHSQGDIGDEHDPSTDALYTQSIPGLPDFRSAEDDLLGMAPAMHGSSIDRARTSVLEFAASSLDDTSSMLQIHPPQGTSTARRSSQQEDIKAEKKDVHNPSSTTNARQHNLAPSVKANGVNIKEVDDLVGSFQCEHPNCGKVMKRGCDLRKHAKRHTRPYGCTFRGCASNFGSRNDWKRHENTQHFLPAMWKCRLKAHHSNSTCEFPAVLDIDKFNQHLRNAHKCHDERALKKYCTQFQLGREGNNSFWCGFCRQVVPQDKKAVQAWKVRGDHIGDHFDKGGCKIEDWFCIESNRYKRDIVRDEQARHAEEEDELSAYEPDIPDAGHTHTASYFPGNTTMGALDPSLVASDQNSSYTLEGWT